MPRFNNFDSIILYIGRDCFIQIYRDKDIEWRPVFYLKTKQDTLLLQSIPQAIFLKLNPLTKFRIPYGGVVVVVTVVVTVLVLVVVIVVYTGDRNAIVVVIVIVGVLVVVTVAVVVLVVV